MALFLLGSLALSNPQAARVTLEAAVKPYNASTSSWFVHSQPASDSIIKLTTVLRLNSARRALLESTLFAVSDPTNSEYGNHKTTEEIAEILAVPKAQISRVVDFWKLNGAAAVEVHPTKDTLTVAISVADVERALSTRLSTFAHANSPAHIVRATQSYSLPAEIAADVAMVGELHQFPHPRVLPRASPSDLVETTASWPNTCKSSACANAVTPSVLAKRYNIPSTKSAANGNSMAVAEFQGQYYKPSDLKLFKDDCGIDATVDKQIGTERDSAGVEAELDIEYIKAVADGIPLTVVYDASYSLLSWMNQVIGLSNPPLINSVSYGNDEAQQTSTEYMESCNTAFMKAGTMGLSVLFASGDQGVCGREGCGFFKKKFHPDFPAASPYVTAVGGTDFASKGVIGDEKAWNDGGGGQSDTFDIPSYQASFVSEYLSNPDADLPDSKLWNQKGRAYPDIAALAGVQNPYCVATSGKFSGVGGTSAACPVAAGIFARLNGIRLASNGKPLGFLNPFLYQNPKAFNDVKEGKITGGTAGGFTAIKGYDFATGLGTPDYEKLAKLV
jgi:tripeptidyl-peptidase-1